MVIFIFQDSNMVSCCINIVLQNQVFQIWPSYEAIQKMNKNNKSNIWLELLVSMFTYSNIFYHFDSYTDF